MKAKRKKNPVVDLVRVSPQGSSSQSLPRPLAPAAVQSVQRSKMKTCPVCREHPASVPVTIGVLNVLVCSPCSEPIFDGITAAGSLSRLILRWFG